MLFKLPTFALTLALLSVQIQALPTYGSHLISPLDGQTFKVGDLLPFKYQTNVKVAYQIQLQHADGSDILTFATDITTDVNTSIIAAQFLVPKPHNISHRSGPVQAKLAVLQSVPCTEDSSVYMVAQTVALTITA
ncbi:BQ5605_C008g05354 [Microbotryum silenes-dioicae]|uniref:BQ5605_C008g05354 protein n=1 Tax=Microbotryum silenes-dioicae TaxID=796604 RepID=A0A2X0P8A8_9BASI|nr:BQ5605_C008g05354 [Microbotryum silenes-dioicae]